MLLVSSCRTLIPAPSTAGPLCIRASRSVHPGHRLPPDDASAGGQAAGAPMPRCPPSRAASSRRGPPAGGSMCRAACNNMSPASHGPSSSSSCLNWSTKRLLTLPGLCPPCSSWPARKTGRGTGHAALRGGRALAAWRPTRRTRASPACSTAVRDARACRATCSGRRLCRPRASALARCQARLCLLPVCMPAAMGLRSMRRPYRAPECPHPPPSSLQAGRRASSRRCGRWGWGAAGRVQPRAHWCEYRGSIGAAGKQGS